MKRWMAIMVAVLLLVSCFGFSVNAETQPLAAQVTVTIADEGTLVLTQRSVTVKDYDDDKKITINDALYAAHEAAYTGGVAAGYATAQTQYGLSIAKLWGDESGNFGYYVNNASAWSLVDVVGDGDTVYAYVYADGTSFSDMYTYFDKSTVTAGANGQITLTLSGASFDAQWNPVTVPVAGAVITVDGKATETVTDAEGKCTLTLDSGAHTISAVSETQMLVPPVCVVTVEESEKTEPENTPVPENVPQTGVAVGGVGFVLIASLVLMGVCKKRYAK